MDGKDVSISDPLMLEILQKVISQEFGKMNDAFWIFRKDVVDKIEAVEKRMEKKPLGKQLLL